MKKYLSLVFYMTVFLYGCKKSSIKPVVTAKKNIIPYTVINEGVNGNTVPMLLARIDSVTNKKPDLVIIMIGTNDVAFGGLTFANFESNLTSLVSQLQTAGSSVMLLTPPPPSINGPYYTILSNLDSACRVINRVSKTMGCNFIDINSDITLMLQENPALSIYNTDGLHPNKTGYIYIGGYVSAYMLTNGITKKKIVCFGDSITNGYMVDGAGTSEGDTYPAVLQRNLNQSE